MDSLQKEKEELVLALQSAKKDTNQAKYKLFIIFLIFSHYPLPTTVSLTPSAWRQAQRAAQEEAAWTWGAAGGDEEETCWTVQTCEAQRILWSEGWQTHAGDPGEQQVSSIISHQRESLFSERESNEVFNTFPLTLKNWICVNVLEIIVITVT